MGTALVKIRVAEQDGSDVAEPQAPSGTRKVEASPSGSAPLLVGYGAGAVRERRRRVRMPEQRPGVDSAKTPATSAMRPRAKPPVRRIAREMGVDLARVTGTGVDGEVLREDVMRAAEQARVFRNVTTPQWSTQREERIPVRGVRKQTALAMSASAFTAPHVTVFVDVDATRTMEYVRRVKESPDFAGVRISPLLVMCRAIIWAVQRNPGVNAHFDDDAITIHHYVNLGVAAATPRGLIVPNIKDAHLKSMRELALSLNRLTSAAREGSTARQDMSGGTITVTNIGVFGVDSGTPILNPGEVAIVALGSIRMKPWVVDGRVQPRHVTTVAATLDHRAVDGDVASRFVADIATILEEPALLVE